MKGKYKSRDKNDGWGERMTEAWRRKERHGDRFAGCSGYSERPEAPKVILWGSWRLCTPSLTLHLLEFNSINQYQIILPRSKYFQQQWEKRNEILLNFKNHPRGLVFKSTQMIFSRKYIPLIWRACRSASKYIQGFSII